MLSDFRFGEEIRHLSIVRVQKIGATTSGGVFARGVLQDNSGSLNFISFKKEVVDFLKADPPLVLTVYGTIQVDRYAGEGAKQVNIEEVEIPLEHEDLSHLLPTTAKNIAEYEARLQGLVDGMAKKHLRQLLKNIFSGEIYKKFLQNPAAMSYHHAYLGGLLEHSLDTARLAKAIGGEYPDADVDLIVAGALLHDLGKIKEISPQIGFEYTLSGRYIGHIALGAMMVEKAIAKTENFPQEDALALVHIIISHHGALEKGSPVAPVTREALIVHYADEINSTLNQIEQLALSDQADWQYSKMLGRQVRVR